MLELLYTSSKMLSGTGWMAYVASWDALVAFWGGNINKVFRDGSMAYLGGDWGGVKGNRVGGRHFYMDTFVGTAWCYLADEITGQVHTDQVLNPDWKVPPGTGAYLDDVAGYYLKAGVSPVEIYRLATGALLGQVNLGFIPDNLAYAGPGRVVAIRHYTGDVAILDYQAQVMVWKSKVRPCAGSAYDLRHHLIVTLESDKLVRVYLLDPVPAALTDPVFTPAPRTLLGSLVQTRLMGDAGEPCPGYWVEWEILGTPPKGSLYKPYSKTDADGYAENFYYGPALGEEAGQESLKVSVRI